MKVNSFVHIFIYRVNPNVDTVLFSIMYKVFNSLVGSCKGSSTFISDGLL